MKNKHTKKTCKHEWKQRYVNAYDHNNGKYIKNNLETDCFDHIGRIGIDGYFCIKCLEIRK